MPTRQNGAAIRQLRQERGLELRELASQVRITSRGLSNIESGNRPASVPVLYRIARCLTEAGDPVSYEALLAQQTAVAADEVA